MFTQNITCHNFVTVSLFIERTYLIIFYHTLAFVENTIFFFIQHGNSVLNLTNYGL